MPALTGLGGCARCGDALEGNETAALCRACRLAPPPFERAVAFGVYRGRLKDAIHALKYDGLHPAARGLGAMLAGAIGQLAGETPGEMLVTPVPLHRRKQAQRGFNQAWALAGEALRILRRSHPQWRLTFAPGLLARVRATESQAGLTPRQRRLNVRAAFAVTNPAAVKDKNILVIDDIMTTGATARAAARAFMRAGANAVWVATLARARRDGPTVHQARQAVAKEDSVFHQEPGFPNKGELGTQRDFVSQRVSKGPVDLSQFS
jgi:ComF family protein